MNKLVWGMAVAVGLSGEVHAGAIRYVDDDAPPNGDGLSWDTAYKFLQDSLFEAEGDATINEIHVAGGTYKPDEDEGGNVAPEDRTATFQLIDGVAILGGYAGLSAGKKGDPNERDVSLYAAILSGDLLGNDIDFFVNRDDNSYHVVTAEANDASAILDGYTVRGGNADGPEDFEAGGIAIDGGAPTISRCTIAYNLAENAGGMILAESSATITECAFIGNKALYAGGVLAIGGGPSYTDCTFIGNQAYGDGGGMISYLGDATITGCTFQGNRAECWAGGAIQLFGNPIVADCQFIDNRALGEAPWGGAIAIADQSSPIIIGCTFDGNAAVLGSGGGILSHGSPIIIDCLFIGSDSSAIEYRTPLSTTKIFPILMDCAFVDNEDIAIRLFAFGGSTALLTVVNSIFSQNTGSIAGAIMLFSNPGFARINAINCTFVNNVSRSGGAINDGSDDGPAPSVVVNSILRGNQPAQIVDDHDQLTVSYSNVEGGWPGTGNIDADPLFVDPDDGDYHLQAGSPANDAGHNWAIAGLAGTDLDGNPRFADDPAATDTGCGVPVIVDMGAYEFQGDPFPVKLGDIDGDGVVGIIDFLALLAAWGPCTKDCCLPDLDLDGVVGIMDFLILLAEWG